MRKRVLNSVKLQQILDKWPDLTNDGQRIRACDISARMSLEDLVKTVKQDELFAKELEEKSQMKLL